MTARNDGGGSGMKGILGSDRPKKKHTIHRKPKVESAHVT